MTRTFISGVAGFTGRHLARLLADLGHEVHGLVHVRDDDKIDGVECLYEADLTDVPSLRKIVEQIRPDYVVHLAAIAFVAHADIAQMYQTNVLGTRQLLDSLASLDATPQAVLLASSANVYGDARGGVIDEATLPAPGNDYGVTKVSSEYVAALYQARLPITVVRPFNYTGRGQNPDFIIPKIVAHARERAATIELGNVDVARDFSDVRTVVDAYARVLTEPAAVGGTFNVCSGRAVTLIDVLELVGSLSGHRLQVEVNPTFVRPNEVRSLCGSAAKLESVIGPMKPIPLDQTLLWMLED